MLKITIVAALLGAAGYTLASDVAFDQRSLAPAPSAASQAKQEAPRPVCACAHHGAASK